MKKAKRECVGYEIIGTLPTRFDDGSEITLGFNERKNEYVTWYYDVNTGYNCGHYFLNYDDALIDMIERAN